MIDKEICMHSAIWDLHIHTCKCPKVSGTFKKMSVSEYVDDLLEIIKKYPILEMISFTDHNQISIDVYKEFYSRNYNITLIPGIEVDIELEGIKHPKHLIIYFNLDRSNYQEISEKINIFLNKKTPIKIETFLDFLVGLNVEFVVSPHAFKQGKRSIDHDWTSPEIVHREAHKYMDQFFCFWEASGQSSIVEAKKFLEDFELDSRIAVISFSDSNTYEKFEKYLQSPNQFFNALPNFKGLQMVGTDCRRIVRSYKNIREDNVGNLIGKIRINTSEIKLSPKLNVIIGGRGSGKSLLLDSIALNLDSKIDETNKIINQNRKKFLDSFNVSIEKYNGDIFRKNSINFDYFNQSYVTKIFDNPNPSDVIRTYFKEEFDGIDDINVDSILSTIKTNYKEFLSSISFEKLDNISSFIEKYPAINNSKLAINISRKNKSKETTIVYPEYANSYKAILGNKSIVPRQLSKSNNIKVAVKDLLKVIYQEVYTFNNKTLLSTGKNFIIDAFIKKKNELSETSSEKSATETLFLKHLEQKEKGYINRVSIINSIIEISKNFRCEYINRQTKEGINDSKFTFEKKLVIEHPLHFFMRISQKYLNGQKINKNDINELIYAFCFNIDDYIKDTQTVDEYVKILTELNNLETEISSNIYYSHDNNEPENILNCSPGTQTNILMEYIVSKKTNNPLLIDQPEDNIDNETIYLKLTDWFNKLKHKRQIIVVTHDANIVVNADAENVIIASKVSNNEFNYEFGALEYKNNLITISNILDGGIDAVERRLKKYGRNKD